MRGSHESACRLRRTWFALAGLLGCWHLWRRGREPLHFPINHVSRLPGADPQRHWVLVLVHVSLRKRKTPPRIAEASWPLSNTDCTSIITRRGSLSIFEEDRGHRAVRDGKGPLRPTGESYASTVACFTVYFSMRSSLTVTPKPAEVGTLTVPSLFRAAGGSMRSSW